jgi:hypothetical protein
MTRLEFAPIMATLSAAAGRGMPEDQAEIYRELLGDLPVRMILAAIRRCVAESRYPGFPPVGAIRAAAADLRHAGAPPWPEAWQLACDAAGRYGLSRERQALAALDQIHVQLARAVRAIGWQALCDAACGDLDTLRAQFRDAYSTLSERDEREGRLPLSLRRADVARLTEGLGALPAPEDGGFD